MAALSARLIASGDLGERSLAAKSVFDDTLEMAIKSFQDRYGLPDDGTVCPGTIAALNIPALAYFRKVAVNMERWRWLPRDSNQDHLSRNSACIG